MDTFCEAHSEFAPSVITTTDATGLLGRDEWPRIDDFILLQPSMDPSGSLIDAVIQVTDDVVTDPEDAKNLKKESAPKSELDQLLFHISNITATLRLGKALADVRLAVSDDPEFPMRHSDHNLSDSVLKTATATEGRVHTDEWTTLNPDMIAGKTFITDLPRRPEDQRPLIRERAITSENVPKNSDKMIEYALFPGVHEAPQPLSNNVRLLDIITATLRSLPESKLATERLRKQLHTPVYQHLLLDLFWYMFVFFCQPNEQAEQRLLIRIAANYTAVFYSYRDINKDAFFESLPSVLSRIVIASFQECYSKSRDKFDARFQTEVCDMLEEWFSGKISYHPLCEQWKQKRKNYEASSKKSADGDSPASTILRDLHMAKPRVHVSTPVSNKHGPGPIVRRVPFDVYSISPMIQFYLHLHGMAKARRSVRVHRSERERDTVPEGLPTFQQLIGDSEVAAKARAEDYKVKQDELGRERNRLSVELAAHLKTEAKELRKLLRKPHLIKEKADEIIKQMQEERSSKKTATHSTSSKGTGKKPKAPTSSGSAQK